MYVEIIVSDEIPEQKAFTSFSKTRYAGYFFCAKTEFKASPNQDN